MSIWRRKRKARSRRINLWGNWNDDPRQALVRMTRFVVTAGCGCFSGLTLAPRPETCAATYALAAPSPFVNLPDNIFISLDCRIQYTQSTMATDSILEEENNAPPQTKQKSRRPASMLYIWSHMLTPLLTSNVNRYGFQTTKIKSMAVCWDKFIRSGQRRLIIDRRPILTPKTVLPIFFAVGIIFAPIGGLLLWASASVSDIQESRKPPTDHPSGSRTFDWLHRLQFYCDKWIHNDSWQ